MAKGKFDLQDLCDQLAQVEKIGGLGGIMGLLPGVAKMKDQLAKANLDDGLIKRQRAIILSMTPKERRNPDLLKASRKKRIAAGSGAKVEEVNKLLKQHRQMADLMKSFGAGKRGGMMGKAAQMMGLGGGGMEMPSPEELQKLQEKLGGAPSPKGVPGLPAAPPADLLAQKPTLPGLGQGLLSGLNPFGKKK
jgi:signal recognition particle subunit SRP54